jgi:tRNA(adenine34) deaminase
MGACRKIRFGISKNQINTLMTFSVNSTERFMAEALKQANLAFESGEVPVGAVIVAGNKIIARAHNQVELLKDPTAHAEMLAITSACEYLGGKYLDDCTLYVTLEPCAMCAGAMNWAQLGAVYYGASDEKRGYSLVGKMLLHPRTKVYQGVLAEESRLLLEDFFRQLRD